MSIPGTTTRIIRRFGEMPEFPILKIQRGQVEWNGGTVLEYYTLYTNSKRLVPYFVNFQLPTTVPVEILCSYSSDSANRALRVRPRSEYMYCNFRSMYRTQLTPMSYYSTYEYDYSYSVQCFLFSCGSTVPALVEHSEC